jgi:hypothetical protein
MQAPVVMLHQDGLPLQSWPAFSKAPSISILLFDVQPGPESAVNPVSATSPSDGVPTWFVAHTGSTLHVIEPVLMSSHTGNVAKPATAVVRAMHVLTAHPLKV